MDQKAIYTNFPNLYGTIKSKHTQATLQLDWFVSPPQEILILSWATLLQSYTSTTEPVFLFEGKAIQVNLPVSSWTEVEVEDASAQDGHHTAITLNKPFKAPALALELFYNPDSGSIALASGCCIPESFLPQVLSQLQHIVSSRAALGDTFCVDSTSPLSMLNLQRKVLPGPHFLHQLVHAASPSTIAIDFMSAGKARIQLSYQDLNQLSDRLAMRLTSAFNRYDHCGTLNNGIIVPVLIPQSPELYIAQIAVLKSGAAFCPLSLDAPSDRLKFIMKDVGARVVVTTQYLRHHFADSGFGLEIVSRVINEDDEDQAADVCLSSFTQAEQDAEKLAYVMYTSGSTGLPKGVGVTHRAVTQALLAHDEHVPHYSRFLQFAAPTFDVSVFEVFFTFYRGATLVCCHREDMLSDLTGVMNELNVDAAELTPTVAKTLLRDWDAVPSLKLLLTIGETLSRSMIETFAQSNDRERILLPMYGPTEASIHCTIAPKIHIESKAGTIGRPLSTVSAFIITEEQRDQPHILPVGHIGELAVGGQLAQGYINRFEQTHSAFLTLAGYGLVYRTGDRVRLIPSGELEYLGRIASGQVKIRGQRVELGEIEQVICQVNNVRFAVTSLIHGKLIVFCLPDEKSISISHQALQEKCKAWLPPFMRPHEFVFLTEEMPRLSSGKIDKQSLESLYLRQSACAKSVADQSPSDLEKLIADVIREELGIDIAPCEDLWSKGLDSLRSIRLASKLRDKGIEVAVTDLLSADTVLTLSKVLQERPLSRSALTPVYSQMNCSKSVKDILRSEFGAGEISDIEDIVPCSKMQLAMLSESVIAKNVNFNWLKIELSKSVPVTDFVQAFCRLAELNDVLRSGFIHPSHQEFQFFRVIWKSFDPIRQIRYEELGYTGAYAPEETPSLSRPLRLLVAASKDHITVSAYVHHALYDGWSWDLMMTDLNLMISGVEAPERPNFQQFVQYEMAFLSSPKATASREHWEKHLQDINPTPFPVLVNVNCKAEIRTFRRTSKVNLPVLDAMSQRLRVSRHSIPSAAFATLLSLYCGTSEVVFGSVSSGRTLPIAGIEDVIGPCISTLPLKVNLDYLRTVGDLVLHMHRLHHDFLHFGQLPLRDIKKAAGITGPQAFFDALFVWQESVGCKRNAKSAFSVTDSIDSLLHALILEVEPEGHQVQMKATYDTSVLCVEHIEMFLSQFDAVIAYYAQAPNAPWRAVLSHIQPHDLSIANPDFSSFDSTFGFSSTIDRLARDDPTRIAIEFVDDFEPVGAVLKTSKVSYYELSEGSSLVSQFFLAKGVLVDELVCLFMRKSNQLYISILGILKAGAAYIVVDPQAPSERARRTLEVSMCRHCLTEREFEDHELLGKVESVLFFGDIGESAQHEVLRPSVKGTNLAYAVFTSGSTGIPKGVMITRNNILSNINALSGLYPSAADGALLQACSPAFDVSVFEILYTWHMGMRLCAASNDVLFRDIEQFIELLKVTHLSLTPSVAALIRPDDVPNVKMLVTAGEAVTSKVFRDWAGRGLHQGYGPSETTNICSIRCDVSASDHINNIGSPLPNTSIFVSGSEAFEPLPIGALGELVIGGDQVGRGYLNDVDKTATKFIDHGQYGRLYRSGDLGRMLPNGSILFHGRQDDQVKLRGQRIELGEIEHALLHESIVSDSTCLLVEVLEQTSKRLVGFWSWAGSLSVDPMSCNKLLFENLQSQLPEYMVPDYLIHVDVVPLTSQGKTDRKALKQLFLNMDPAALERYSREEDSSEREEVMDSNEMTLAQAITEVTGSSLSVIRRNTSFFSLGLDSISCISLSKKLFESGFALVDVSLILRHASIAKLLRALPGTTDEYRVNRGSQSNLQYIFDKRWKESIRLKYAQKGYQVQQILPCTPLQQAMLSQSEGGSDGAYQNQLKFSIFGDLQQMKAAWSTCIAAHNILRTGFVLTNSSQFPFAQVVLADFMSPWDHQNLPAQTETDWEQFMMPPYSLTVAGRSDTLPPRLILKIHHALYDAQAVSLLLHDVEQVYQGRLIKATVSLEPYLEYMVALDGEHADKFWRTHLKDYRPKLLSEPSRARESRSGRNGVVCHVSSKITFQALLNSSKQNNVTILSLLQLAWVRLLANYSHETDICFGNVYSGRNLPIRDVEKIIGPCFNTLPVRVILGTRDTNQEVARRLQDHNLAALRLQPFSLRLIHRSHGVSRLFDTLLLLQAEPAGLHSSIWSLEKDAGYMKVPLILEIIPRSSLNLLDLVIHAEQSYLPADGAEAILADFDIILQHVIQYPDASATDGSIFEHKEPLLLIHPPATANTAAAAYSTRHSPEENWSLLERYVCGVLCKVSPIDVSRLGRNTTVFNIGFDSLNAIQIAVTLRKDGYRLTGGDILEAATVPGIASLCEKNLPNGQDHSVSFDFDDFHRKHVAEVCQRNSINHQAVEEIRPCTPFQSGILADFVQSGGRHYLNSMRYELDSNIDIHLLKEAWEAVSSRHDILRTGFIEIIDNAMSSFAMILYFPEVCALPWSEDDIPLVQSRSEYAQSLLETLHKPPWRVFIKNQGARKEMHLLMLHALFDARTFELLLDEVTMAYRGERLPEVFPIKPCISEILQKSSSQPAENRVSLYDPDSRPSARFPNLHSHNLVDGGCHTTEFDCSHSLIRLQASCRKAGVTLQVASQCAWARLLSAYTGEASQTFGVVLSGRSVENKAQSLLFPCINTVPLTMKVEGVTNRTLLAAATRQNATIMKNPFAIFKERLKNQREMFDSLFVFQNWGMAGSSSLWNLVSEDARASYTVSIELLTNRLETLCVRLTFDRQIIPVEQGRMLVRQFDAILLDTLDRLDGEASSFIHVAEDLTSVAPAKHTSIETEVKYLHQFVEISSQKSPQKIAFEFAVDIVGEEAIKTSWTYSQLDREGNRIAHIIQQNGAPPGALIGICFDKCPEAIFTILGILKAGCGYVALDPHAPETRKRFILEDSGCRVLCTTQAQVDSLPLMDNLQTLRVDKLLKDKDFPCDAVVVSRTLVADDVCYCLYTSGTTGTPKGCLITHGNAVQFVLAFQRLFTGHWDIDSRFLQFASFHFDVSVMEQYWSWSIGICVTSAPRDLLFEDLSAAIRALKITHLDLTPSLARLLTPEECPSLRRGAFITGGEQLRQDIIDAWADEGVIYNGYGPSEVTIGCTMYPRVPKSAKPSNIGHAFDNVGAYVLASATKRPVLRGAIGELCVSGPLVGKGYLNRAELTAEKFEFLDHLQAQVYHTGDLVRLLHDGSFCFIRRADDQVKLRGQRLEIGEINHVVRQTSKTIKEVATLVLEHRKDSKPQIVTFITSSEALAVADHVAVDSTPHLSSLIHHIRRSCNGFLPGYMVPTYIVPVTAMPLSTNNKIDTKPLKSLFEAISITKLQELSATESSARQSDSHAMKKVIGIISQAIGLPEDAIHPSSRLFELGFDSVSAISLSRMLKCAEFPLANPSTILQNFVVADLVSALTEPASIMDHNITAMQAAKQGIAAFEKAHRSAIEKEFGTRGRDIEKIAPCTPLQEGMIARTLTTSDALYFSSFTFALDAGTDVVRLQAAWLQVEKENEILRTRFVLTGDGYAQVVFKNPTNPSTRFQRIAIDRGAGSKDALKHNFMHWVENVRSLQSELWALFIYDTARETLINLHIFHGLYDGISLALILEEVACHYAGRTRLYPKPAYHHVLPLGPLFSAAGARDFWTQNIHEIHLLDLPMKHDMHEVVVASNNLAHPKHLKQLQLQLDVTVSAIFQACWLMTLERNLGVLPTVGEVVSGRALDVDGMDNVVGPLFNTIPCQIDMAALSTMADLVRACHAFNVHAMPYQHTPLSKISKWLGRNSADPLFDSLFVFQVETRTSIESRKLWRQVDSTFYPDYPLAFEVEQQIDGSLICTVLTRGQYLCLEEAQRLLDVLKSTLMDLLEDPHQPLKFLRRRCARPLDTNNTRSRSNGIVNIKQRKNSTVNSDDSFRWDATSETIRSEIVKLSASGIHNITPYTSIFELGLDSIDAIKLSAGLKSTKISISVSSILQAGSIAEMLKSVSAAGASSSSSLHPSLEQVTEHLRKILKTQGVPVDDYERVLPVTPLQESMLANYEQYYNQDILRVSKGINAEKLKSAWHVAVSTHDVLRTSFVAIEDPESAFSYAQLVSQDAKFDYLCMTLGSEAELQALLYKQRSEAGHKSFNQPALHLTFVGIGSNTFLIVGLPHAVYDGWSINLLHQDVARCYNGLHCARPGYQPVLEHILGAVSEESRSFWRSKLSGLCPRSFCLSRNDQPTYLATNRHQASSQVQLTQATAFCRAEGVTLPSLSLTCWALVLARYLKCRDVCFGVVMAGRDFENADKMMFPTMNTVPFRILLRGSRSEMVKDVHKLIIGISEHQHFPLRKAKSLVASADGQLFDTLFVYQKSPSKSEQLNPLYESWAGLSDPEHPVNVEMELLHDKMVWRTACRNDVLDMQGTQALLHSIDNVLRSIVDDPSGPAFTSLSDEISICGMTAFKDRTDGGSSFETHAAVSKEICRDQLALLSDEKVIREVLATIANVEREKITRSTSLFQIGLDSISAIKVSYALKKRSIMVPVSEMLKAVTLQRIAEIAKPLKAVNETRLANQHESKIQLFDQDCVRQSLKRVSIREDQVEHVFPCTSGQQFFLGTWQASGGRLFYPEFYYRIHGPSISRQTIDAAWQRLVQAAPVLRTIFLAVAIPRRAWLQVTLKETCTRVVWTTDKSHSTKDTNSVSPSYAQPPVMLSATETPTAVLLRLRIHHGLYDGVSLPRMINAFKSFCHSSSSLPDLETDLHGYLNYLDNHAMKEQQKNFWTSYLHGSPTFQLHSSASFEAERVQVFRPRLLDSLRLIEKEISDIAVSFQALFFAAYALVHSRLRSSFGCPSEDLGEVIVGVYLANRSHNHRRLSKLLAPTVNVVPIRIPVRHEPSLLEAAIRVQGDLGKIRSIEHCSASLSEIYEWTDVRIDCFVNFLKLPDMFETPDSVDDVTLEELEFEDQLQNTVKEQEPPSPFAGCVPPQETGVHLPLMDIEAAIRNGMLDVGVFAPANFLNEGEAENLLGELQAVLKGIGQ